MSGTATFSDPDSTTQAYDGRAPTFNWLFGNEWGVGDLPGGVVIHQK